MTTANISASPSQLTSANLSRTIDELKSGETIEIKRLHDGTINISLVMTKGDKRNRTHIENRMQAYLQPQPVTQSWMALVELPTDKDKKIRKEHRHEIKKKSNSAGKAKAILKSGLEVLLSFMDMENAARVQMKMSSYWLFDIGGKMVYCKSDKTPVMYKDGERGELIYL